MAEMWSPVAARMKRGESVGTAVVQAQVRRGRRRFGSYVVHAGAVITIVAIAVSSTMRTTREFQLDKGQSGTVGSWGVTALGVEERQEPHRASTIARFAISKNGKPVATLTPRMSHYPTMREPVGSPDVYSTLGGDFYISLMNVDAASQRVGFSVYYTPMIGWLWISVILMGIGGLIALIPPRTPRIEIASEPVVHGGVPAGS
jgi:cytochrome c-type biogenesis protein CcmF